MLLYDSNEDYRKFPKYSDTQKLCCNHSKIWNLWLYHRVVSPNDVDGMANNVDPDQTAPGSSLIWVRTVCPGISVRKLRIITVISDVFWRQTNHWRKVAAFPSHLVDSGTTLTIFTSVSFNFRKSLLIQEFILFQYLPPTPAMIISGFYNPCHIAYVSTVSCNFCNSYFLVVGRSFNESVDHLPHLFNSGITLTILTAVSRSLR